MTVLVTGGTGFVGLNLAERLLGRGDDAVLLADRPLPDSAGRAFDALPGVLRVVTGDVRDRSALDEAFAKGIDRVIHAAVITADAARAQRAARTVAEVNLLGTIELLEAAARHGAGRIVQVSSAAVYGAAAYDVAELTEAAPAPLPDSLYGITKFAAERTALLYREAQGLDLVAARLTALFGRWEYATGVRDTLSAPLQLLRLAKRGEAVVLPREEARDWLYGVDAADALIALLDQPDLPHDTYVVGPGETWSVARWCETLAAARPGFTWRFAGPGEAANVDFFGPRDRAPLNPERLARDTSFRARFGPGEAFADYLAWAEQHDIWAEQT